MARYYRHPCNECGVTNRIPLKRGMIGGGIEPFVGRCSNRTGTCSRPKFSLAPTTRVKKTRVKIKRRRIPEEAAQ